jgi:hypothetical protein
MSDEIIGSITGTATFDWVEVAPKETEGGMKANVIGYYDGSTTAYRCDLDRVRIGGLKLRSLHDVLQLEPEDRPVWVEATDDLLLIQDEKPE